MCEFFFPYILIRFFSFASSFHHLHTRQMNNVFIVRKSDYFYLLMKAGRQKERTLNFSITTNREKHDHRDQRRTRPALWRRKTVEVVTKSINCQKVAQIKVSKRMWVDDPHPNHPHPATSIIYSVCLKRYIFGQHRCVYVHREVLMQASCRAEVCDDSQPVGDRKVPARTQA